MIGVEPEASGQVFRLFGNYGLTARRPLKKIGGLRASGRKDDAFGLEPPVTSMTNMTL
jgi:hypothetical protein